MQPAGSPPSFGITLERIQARDAYDKTGDMPGTRFGLFRGDAECESRVSLKRLVVQVAGLALYGNWLLTLI